MSHDGRDQAIAALDMKAPQRYGAELVALMRIPQAGVDNAAGSEYESNRMESDPFAAY
jgi:hypothetical protein